MQAPVIYKNTKLPESEDYLVLRRKALEYIQAMGHNLWTDYNLHDPGISIMELFCYALTDATYRANAEVRDLLTENDNGQLVSKGTFHEAADILSSHPVTFRDLRKLLVDIKGVRNAWIIKHDKTKYGINASVNRLVHKSVSDNLPTISLNGLYEVAVEYEEVVEPLRLGRIIKAPNGSYVRANGQGLSFRVTKDLKIKSVGIYPDRPGLVSISLYRNKSIIRTFDYLIEEKKVGTKVQVPINEVFDFIPGFIEDNQYSFRVNSVDGVHLYTNFEDIDHDYAIEEFGAITDGVPNDGIYYFLYDWHIEPAVFSDDLTQQFSKELGILDHIGAGSGRFAEPGEGQMILEVLHDKVTIEAVSLVPYLTTSSGKSAKIDLQLRTYDSNAPDKEGMVVQEKEVVLTPVVNTSKMRIPLNWEVKTGVYYLEAKSKEPGTVKLFLNEKSIGDNFTVEDIFEIQGARTGDTGKITFSDQVDPYYFFYSLEIGYEKPLTQDTLDASLDPVQIKQNIRNVLGNYRNLCEDLITIHEIKTEEVLVDAQIILRASADINAVKAEILYRLEKHISPPVKFYTLQEMLDKGKSVEEIFDGPLLQHGFIDDEEFSKTEQLPEVRVSDLVDIISKVDGVVEVSDVTASNYLDGQLQEQSHWVIKLSEDPTVSPNFNPSKNKSCFKFTQNGVTKKTDNGVVESLLIEKIQSNKPETVRKSSNRIPIPVGLPKGIGEYYPMQNELPVNYLVGTYRVPDNFPPLRKAQSLQLKAFLMFFEQLLADYLAQISHLAEIFSWNPDRPYKTLFTQRVTGITELDKIYKDYDNLQQELEILIESGDGALKNTNKVLDHLLARFSESFQEYDVLLSNLFGDDQAARVRLIKEKQQFLADYPLISKDRNSGFYYNAPLEKQKLPGFQRRVYRMLGFQRKVKVMNFSEDLLCFENPKGVRIRHSYLEKSNEGGENKIVIKGKLLEVSRNPDRTSNCYEDLSMRDHDYFRTQLDLIKFFGTNQTSYVGIQNQSSSDYACYDLYAVKNALDHPNRGEKLATILIFGKELQLKDVFPIIECLKTPKALLEQPVSILGKEILIKSSIVADHVFENGKDQPPTKWRFRIIEELQDAEELKSNLPEKGRLSLFVSELFTSQVIYQQRLQQALTVGADELHYYYSEADKTWVLSDDENVAVRPGESSIIGYAKQEKAQVDARGDTKWVEDPDAEYPNRWAVLNAFEQASLSEGFHVVEHLLLRPRTLDTALLDLRVPKADQTLVIPIYDPYSFRVTIFLPSWNPRSQDVAFREMVEKTIRTELPAHIYAELIWTDYGQMSAFEDAYFKWLEELRGLRDEFNGVPPLKPKAQQPQNDVLHSYNEALQSLQQAMQNTTEVYPIACLYDESKGLANPSSYMLCNMSLGTTTLNSSSEN